MGQAGSQVRGGGGTRRLLSDCNVVGSVGKGGSIALLLLIGFFIGAGVSWIFFWRRERRQRRIEMEYRNRFGDTVKRDLPDVTAMVKAAHTPTISKGNELTGFDSQLPKSMSTLSEGPLAMGFAGSAKDTLRQALSLKEQRNPASAVVATVQGQGVRGSGGNPFAGEVPSYNVRRNDMCSLNNSPSVSTDTADNKGAPQPLSRLSTGYTQQGGLIGTGVFAPATDPASPRITAQTGGAAPPPPPTTSSFGWPGIPDSPPGVPAGHPASGTGPAPANAAQQPSHARNGSVLVKRPAGANAAEALPPAPAAVAHGGSGSDYMAALHSTAAAAPAVNPFEIGAGQKQQKQQDNAKAAHKQQLLQQVQDEEYGNDDLDPEWASLLEDLDARLQAAGRPRLSDKERAVAIRSLIVATASQSVEAALAKAVYDVEAFRRAQAMRAAS